MRKSAKSAASSRQKKPRAPRDYVASPEQDGLRRVEAVLSTARESGKAANCSRTWIMFWRRGVIALKPEQVRAVTDLVTSKLAELNSLLLSAAI